MRRNLESPSQFGSLGASHLAVNECHANGNNGKINGEWCEGKDKGVVGGVPPSDTPVTRRGVVLAAGGVADKAPQGPVKIVQFHGEGQNGRRQCDRPYHKVHGRFDTPQQLAVGPAVTNGQVVI